MSREGLSPQQTRPECYELTSARVKAILENFPAAIVTGNIKNLKPGNVLDLGSGRGRNALVLASRGFSVTAVDIDPEATAHMQAKARNMNLQQNLTALSADISNLAWAANFDNVIAIYSLRSVLKGSFAKQVSKIQQATVAGGLNIIQEHIKSSPLYNPEFGDHWPAHDELDRLYQGAGWDVQHYREEELPSLAPKTGLPFMQPTATIVARKA